MQIGSSEARHLRLCEGAEDGEVEDVVGSLRVICPLSFLQILVWGAQEL